MQTNKTQLLRRFVRKHKASSAAVGVLLSLTLAQLAWDSTAHVRGHAKARYDLHQGRYEVLTYGLPPETDPEYVRLLRERYNIEVVRIADCIVTRAQAGYANAYDDVSSAAETRKFGPGIFEGAWQAAMHAMSKR